MAMETQQALLDLVSKTLPAQVGQITADRIVIGGQDHGRVTPRKFAKPEYIGFSKDRHVQPEFCYIMEDKQVAGLLPLIVLSD